MDAKKFLLYLAGSFISLYLLMALMGLEFAYHPRVFPNSILLEINHQKIENNPDVEVVFLGDSSLGNTIDERVFSYETGRKTISLPLSELYGFAGDLNLLRAVLKKSTPRQVILMHTPFSFSKDPAYLGYLLTSPFYLDAFIKYPAFSKYYLRAMIRAAQGLTWAKVKKFLRADRNKMESEIRRFGYIKQGPKMHSLPGQLKIEGGISLHKEIFIKQIAQLCMIHKIDCYYVPGPFAKPLAKLNYKDYQQNREFLQALGINYWAAEVFLDVADLGDYLDHPDPKLKHELTRYYASKIPSDQSPIKQ